TTAAPSVPNRQASGTVRLGSSTASEAWAADSMPRKAHRVRGIALPMASEIGRLFGFQAAASTSGLNQNQPMMLKPATGMITPQTVIAPILPVMPGPPKLATVVSQSKPTVPMNSGMAPLPSQGTNDVMYPTAEMATATLAMASERKYRYEHRKNPDLACASSV